MLCLQGGGCRWRSWRWHLRLSSSLYMHLHCTYSNTIHTYINIHNWASKQTTTRIPVPRSLICVLSHTRHLVGSTMTKWIMKSQSPDSALGSFMPVWVNYLTLLHSSLFIRKTRIGLPPPLKITWMRNGKTASEAINPALLASSPGHHLLLDAHAVHLQRIWVSQCQINETIVLQRNYSMEDAQG